MKTFKIISIIILLFMAYVGIDIMTEDTEKKTIMAGIVYLMMVSVPMAYIILN